MADAEYSGIDGRQGSHRLRGVFWNGNLPEQQPRRIMEPDEFRPRRSVHPEPDGGAEWNDLCRNVACRGVPKQGQRKELARGQ